MKGTGATEAAQERRVEDRNAGIKNPLRFSGRIKRKATEKKTQKREIIGINRKN